MALDEQDDDDEVIQQGELTFLINKELLEKAGNLNVELGYMGFVVKSENPVVDPNLGGGACGSCSSGCGS